MFRWSDEYICRGPDYMYRLAPSEDCSISPASRLARSIAANRPFYHQFFFFDPLLIGLEYPFELMRTIDNRKERDRRSARLLE